MAQTEGVRDEQCPAAYAPEFCRQLVQLVHARRSADDVSKEFGLHATTVAKWVRLSPMGMPAPKNNVPQAPLNTAERQELVELRRKLRQVQMERDILAEATDWFAGKSEKTSNVYRLVKATQAELLVRALCETLKVSTSGYYDWLDRSLNKRAKANMVLRERQRRSFIIRIRAANTPASPFATGVRRWAYVPHGNSGRCL